MYCILYYVKRLCDKKGLFGREPKCYQTLLVFRETYESKEDAENRIDTINDWFYIPLFKGLNPHWINTIELVDGTGREAKTCFIDKYKYSVILL